MVFKEEIFVGKLTIEYDVNHQSLFNNFETMDSLSTLWSTFFDICRLRLKPQDLPHSNTLLSVTLFVYTIIGMALSMVQFSLPESLLSALVDTGLLVILIGSLLYFAHFRERTTQTLTALAGTNCVLEIIGSPIIFWFGFYEGDMTIPILLLLGLIVWNMVVYAHILRHALSVPFFISGLLTMIIYSLTFSVLSQLIPFAK